MTPRCSSGRLSRSDRSRVSSRCPDLHSKAAVRGSAVGLDGRLEVFKPRDQRAIELGLHSVNVGADWITREGLVCTDSNAVIGLPEKPLVDAGYAARRTAPQRSAVVRHFVDLRRNREAIT